MRRLLKQMLDVEPDLDVIGESSSAEVALAQLADLQPDLLTVDLSLPGMNGLELITTLKKTHSALRCLVVTGHADASYKVAASEAGAVGFVTKDDPDKVLAAIRSALKAVTPT